MKHLSAPATQTTQTAQQTLNPMLDRFLRLCITFYITCTYDWDVFWLSWNAHLNHPFVYCFSFFLFWVWSKAFSWFNIVYFCSCKSQAGVATVKTERLLDPFQQTSSTGVRNRFNKYRGIQMMCKGLATNYFGDKQQELTDCDRSCIVDLSLYGLFKQCYISLSSHVILGSVIMNPLVVCSRGIQC